MSHPSWVRGLKLLQTLNTMTAWQSHPSWVRGLKPLYNNSVIFALESHPSWVRGLKPSQILRLLVSLTVAPLVGAWIETTRLNSFCSCQICRTPRGCVD